MIAELLPILLSILAQAPQLVESVKEIWGLVSNNQNVTSDQQSQIDAALDAAHKALQDS